MINAINLFLELLCPSSRLVGRLRLSETLWVEVRSPTLPRYRKKTKTRNFIRNYLYNRQRALPWRVRPRYYLILGLFSCFCFSCGRGRSVLRVYRIEPRVPLRLVNFLLILLLANLRKKPPTSFCFLPLILKKKKLATVKVAKPAQHTDFPNHARQTYLVRRPVIKRQFFPLHTTYCILSLPH